VAIAKCDKDMKVASYGGFCVLTIEEVYYHHCARVHPHSAKGEYIHNGRSLQIIQQDRLFADAYAEAVAKIITFKPPPSFLDKKLVDSLSQAEVAQLVADVEEKRGYVPLHEALLGMIPEQPPGVIINFGEASYDYDNRFYLGLPTVSKEYKVDDRKHLSAMSRLGYFIAVTFGATEEFSQFVFDFDLMNSRLHETRVSWRNCFKQNPKYHLQLKDISLLFGGQEKRIRVDPIQQFPHTDVATTIEMGENQMLKNLPPGSVVVPLEKERSIYI
jgi:hypothetical protein